MKKQTIASWITAAIVTASGGDALAIDWAGADVTDDTDWQLGDNWVGGVVPGAGVNVKFPIANDTIDVNGAVNVGEIYISGNGQTFLDTADSITATSLRFHNANTAVFDADLVISGQIYTTRKSINETYNGSVSFGGIDMGQGMSTFNGPVTVTGANGLEAFYKSINSGNTGPIYVFNNTLTSANGGSITSSVGDRVTTVKAGASNTFSGLGGTLNVDAAGILDLVVAQTGATPYGTGGISVNAYGLLVGDTGTNTWGPGNNIDVKNDAVLATSAGSTPTAGDIGVAVAWQGVTGTGTWTAGNDGVGVFKGLAVGGFNNSLSGTTLQAPVGTGAVEILVLPGLNNNTAQSANIVSLDGTGIANIHAIGTFPSKGGSLNASSPANAVTTFNFIGESSATTQSANLYNNFTVKDDQTFNFSGAGWVVVDPTNMKGALTFSGSTQLAATTEQFVNKATAGYANTKLTFNDGASLAIASAEVALLENLDADQIVTSGTPILTLQTSGSNVEATITPQFNINATDTPKLIEFMKKSNINVQGGNNNYADLQGEGLVVGDGKYLMGYSDSHKGLILRAAPHDATTNPHGPAIISGVAGAATMGIAAISGNGNDYLRVQIPVDAKGAKLLINNDQVMTAAKSGNARYTGIANRKVHLEGPITGTSEIDVRAGTAIFGTGVSVPSEVTLTVQSGATAQLDVALAIGRISGTGTVAGASNLAFDTLAPGNSVGTLNMGAFTVDTGTTYEWEIGGTNGVAGSDYDVTLGTTVTITDTWNLDLINLGLAIGELDGSEIFTLVDAGTVNNFNAGNISVTGTGLDVSGVVVSQNGGNIELTGLLVIPEPGTVLLLGLTGLFACNRRRRS